MSKNLGHVNNRVDANVRETAQPLSHTPVTPQAKDATKEPPFFFPVAFEGCLIGQSPAFLPSEPSSPFSNSPAHLSVSQLDFSLQRFPIHRLQAYIQ